MLDWLFLDMDNYFASVGEQDRPGLRGKPVGILPVMSEGSCCIAVSSHAKRRGVRTDLPGINVGIRGRLHRKGICTMRELWNATAQQAQEAWRSIEGRRYWMAIHGKEPALLPEHRRMFTHANVLAPELRTEQGAHSVMTRLLHKAAARLRCHGYVAHTLWAGLRYDDDSRWGDEIPLPSCQNTVTIIEHFQRIWKRKRTSGKPHHGLHRRRTTRTVPMRDGQTFRQCRSPHGPGTDHRQHQPEIR